MCECNGCGYEKPTETSEKKSLMSNFIPDAHECFRSKERMESAIGIIYAGDGWYRGAGNEDYSLIFEEDGWYYVAKYIDSGNVPEIFQKIANLSIQR